MKQVVKNHVGMDCDLWSVQRFTLTSLPARRRKDLEPASERSASKNLMTCSRSSSCIAATLSIKSSVTPRARSDPRTTPSVIRTVTCWPGRNFEATAGGRTIDFPGDTSHSNSIAGYGRSTIHHDDREQWPEIRMRESLRNDSSLSVNLFLVAFTNLDAAM